MEKDDRKYFRQILNEKKNEIRKNFDQVLKLCKHLSPPVPNGKETVAAQEV